MKQFTVYAPDSDSGGLSAVYIVNFLETGAITYPLVDGWSAVAERVERNINSRYFSGDVGNPFDARCRVGD